MKVNKSFILLPILALILTACNPLTPQDGTVSSSDSSTPAVTPPPMLVPLNQGLSCNVYSIQAADYSGSVSFPKMFADGVFRFATVLQNFNVPNESSNNVFASFTAAQQALVGTTNYAIDCAGSLNVPAYGTYILTLGSDDGSALILDYQTVINMPQAQSYATKSASIVLQQGLNPIEILYFQGPATQIGLQLSWQGPSNLGMGTLTIIPATALSH